MGLGQAKCQVKMVWGINCQKWQHSHSRRRSPENWKLSAEHWKQKAEPTVAQIEN